VAPRTVYANLVDGLQPFSLWDQSLADMGLLGAVPCSASGTNAITLTPLAAAFAPNVLAYSNYLLFSFYPAALSSGAVTARVGTLSFLPMYLGGVQGGSGDLNPSYFYIVSYSSTLNGGNGGFQVVASSKGSSSPGGSGLVQVTTSSAVVAAGTPAVAIVRSAPSTTAITLPSVASQSGLPLSIFDWSTSVTSHTITLTPNGSETIMRAATWPMFSNSSNLASLTLRPSTALSGWYIAP
jgi:hypothetical protein